MEKHRVQYKIFKVLLGSFFMLYYRPKVINKNVIPKEGQIIVCGNHIHLFDQCLPIMSTKRMLHYMAKKEYFDSKFAWFFKAAGCISVDRENHGGNSKEIALEVLNEGNAIGIYPEGTRNSVASKNSKLLEIYPLFESEYSIKKFKKIMKKNQVRISQVDYLKELYDLNVITHEEYKASLLDANQSLKELVNKDIIKQSDYEKSLLLPLKFGVASLATKSDATIICYGITGKYRFFKNNLKIVFANPFKTNNMSFEEITQKINYEITNIIK